MNFLNNFLIAKKFFFIKITAFFPGHNTLLGDVEDGKIKGFGMGKRCGDSVVCLRKEEDEKEKNEKEEKKKKLNRSMKKNR